MAFPTQFTGLASTTAATAKGSANFLAIANKWAAQVVSSGQIGAPTFNFSVSCDDTNFTLALPTNVVTNPGQQTLSFDVPAQYVNVSMGANAGTCAVFLIAQSD